MSLGRPLQGRQERQEGKKENKKEGKKEDKERQDGGWGGVLGLGLDNI